MSEIIERAAHAMRSDKFKSGPLSDGETHDERALARAVLEAIREPTEEMKVIGAQYIQNGVVPGPEDAWACWNAMIDAALSQS